MKPTNALKKVVLTLKMYVCLNEQNGYAVIMTTNTAGKKHTWLPLNTDSFELQMTGRDLKIDIYQIN